MSSLLDDWLWPAVLVGLLMLLATIELAAPLHRRPAGSGRRLAANFGLGLVNLALAASLPVSAFAAASWAEASRYGLFNRIELAAPAAIVVTLLLRSLTAYGVHRLLHRVPLLWRVHRVHHCDVAVDLSTGFRSHPLELLVAIAAAAGVTILFGLPPAAVLAYDLAAMAVVLASHANVRLPDGLERASRLVFVTPAMHHVHHSASRPETDSNFGELFSFWDRLFGTHVRLPSVGIQSMQVGLGVEMDSGAESFTRQLGLPFRA